MKPDEIAEELDIWTRIRENGAPPPITEWHLSNGRYVIDGVPFTKPQTEAFIAGLGKGLDWVYKVAEHVNPLEELEYDDR